MNVIPQKQQPKTGSTSEGASSTELTHYQKYHGLLKRSKIKDMRDNLFRFFDYINTMSSSHHYIINIMNAITLFQHYYIALYPAAEDLWPPSSFLGKVMQILSVAALLSPINISLTAHIILVYLQYLFFMITFLVFFVSHSVFQKMSKTSQLAISYITITFNLFPYSFNMIITNLAEDLFHCIRNEQTVLSSIAIVLGITIFLFMITFQHIFISPSLTYRPQILHITYPHHGTIFHITNSFYTFFVTFGSFENGLPRIIFTYIALIPCIMQLLTSFLQHIWGSITLLIHIQSVLISNLLLTITMPTLMVFHQRGNEIVIVVSLVILYLSHYLCKFLMDKYVENINKILQDKIEGKGEDILTDVGYHRLLACLRFGFELGSPICHTWILFNRALAAYPDDYNIILMYARYAAIYVEENASLQVAHRKVKRIKHNSISTKHFLFQIDQLILHRERGFSKSLKKQLQKIQDQTEKCRNQLRFAWECIIRGNIEELITYTPTLKATEESIWREYKQLCIVYPNNPYVMSSYSAFLLDIIGDEKMAQEMQQLYRILRQGARNQLDRCYFYAITNIPTLPSEDAHQALQNRDDKNKPNDNQSMTSFAAIGQIGDIETNKSETKAQKRYIQTMVSTVRLPTTRLTPWFAISVIVLLPVCTIPIMIQASSSFLADRRSVVMIESLALINLYITHLTYLTYQYTLSTYWSTTHAFTVYFYTLKEKYDSVFPPTRPPDFYINDDKGALIQCCDIITSYMAAANLLVTDITSEKSFNKALEFFTMSDFFINHYLTPNSSIKMPVSFQQFINLATSYSIEVTTANITTIFDFPQYWTVILNTDLFLNQSNIMISTLIEAYTRMFSNNAYITTSAAFGCGVVFVIVSLFFIIFIFYGIQKEKGLLFESFRSIPKSTVSEIVANLNAQAGKTDNEETQKIASHQEENALRILSTTHESRFAILSRIWHFIFIIFLFIVAIVLNFLSICYVAMKFSAYFKSTTPLFFQITRIHSDMMESMTMIGRIATINEPLIAQYNNEDYETDLTNLEDTVDHIKIFMHDLHFGNPKYGTHGISSIDKKLVHLSSDSEGHIPEGEIPYSEIEVLEDSSYDTSVAFLNKIIKSMADQIRNGNEGKFHHYKINQKKFDWILMWLFDNSLHGYVLPSIKTLDEIIDDQLEMYRKIYLIIPPIFCMIVVIICDIILIPLVMKVGENATWILRLLLFVEPEIVFHSKSLLKILSNDFSPLSIEDTSNKKEDKTQLFQVITSNSTDGIIFFMSDMKVSSVNKAFLSTLDCKEEDIIGKHVSEIFQEPPNDKSSVNVFKQALKGINEGLRAPHFDGEVSILKKDYPMTVQLSLYAISDRCKPIYKSTQVSSIAFMVLTMRDKSKAQKVRHTLTNEGERNLKLLTFVLPKPIIAKFHKGDTEICFTSPSASIVFINIIGFSNFANGKSPNEVMSILDRLFSEFDEVIGSYHSMNKIKSYGGCYMCAGGVFDEVNQPREHAKAALIASLEIIQKVQQINSELGIDIKIRIGCNTGGPIIAGILGVGQPTFDIFGKEVGIAQVMEQMGVPMSIQITQHMYDLVYGDDFMIRERGDIENDSGIKYHAYLVTEYTPFHV